MKFLCTCGHIIRDQTDALPYKAYCLADEDEDAVFEAVTESLEAFMRARETGKQDEFLVTHFGENYPKELDTKSILSDLLFGVIYATRTIYECENCRRIFFEKSPKGTGRVSYVPEGESRGVLQSYRKRANKEPS